MNQIVLQSQEAWCPGGVHVTQQTRFCIDSLTAAFYCGCVALLEVFVRTLYRIGFVVLLSSALVGMPALASPANPASVPLGVVLQADNTKVGADITAGGATIYDGDRLQTQDGTLRARLGGPQMYLHPGTVAQVHGLPNGFSADLEAGTVVISSTEKQTFQLLADGVTIRPAGAQETIAQVTKVNANELLLTSTRGALEVRTDDEVRTIEAGSSYRMEVDSEDSGSGRQGAAGPIPTGHRHRLVFYLILSAVPIVSGILIWRALLSPSGL